MAATNSAERDAFSEEREAALSLAGEVLMSDFQLFASEVLMSYFQLFASIQ
jgi:hypothetical protein